MLDTTHLLTGLVAGKYLRNPVLAFTTGVLSHFILDSLPHWDGTKTLNQGEVESQKVQDRIRFSPEGKLILTLDILTSLIIFVFLSVKGPLWPNFFQLNSFFLNLYSHPSWLAGVVGALLPDILLLIYILYPSESLKKASMFEFHKKIQKRLPFLPGLTFQLIWVSLCVYLFVN